MPEEQPGHRVVGVYRDRESAAAAAEAARRAGATDVRVGDDADVRTALEGEMAEELEQSVGGLTLGPVTQEGARGAAAAMAVVAIAGCLIGLPFAAIGMGDWPLWARLLLTGGVGAAGGAVVGFIWGATLGNPGPSRRLAAETGITVGADVDGDAVAVAAGMNELSPIRLDVVGELGPRAITNEERRRGKDAEEEFEETAEAVAERAAHQTTGDWRDDYGRRRASNGPASRSSRRSPRSSSRPSSGQR
jgi:hypothetical protein